MNSPDADRLAAALRGNRPDGDAPQVEAVGGGRLRVHGLGAPDIADLAATHRLRVHELVTENTSLEQLFLHLTTDKAAAA